MTPYRRKVYLVGKHPTHTRYLLLLECGHVVERPIARIKDDDRFITLSSPSWTRCERCSHTNLRLPYEEYRQRIYREFAGT